MIFHKTGLQGAYAIEPKRIEDSRGFFARAWCQKEFEKAGLETNFVQCNLSFNVSKGTVRGMHFQKHPYQEVKLVRCTKGEIFDVIVDLVPTSATYLKWFGIRLSEKKITKCCIYQKTMPMGIKRFAMGQKYSIRYLNFTCRVQKQGFAGMIPNWPFNGP